MLICAANNYNYKRTMLCTYVNIRCDVIQIHYIAQEKGYSIVYGKIHHWRHALFTFFFENKISITIPSFLNFQTDANNVSNSHSQQPQQHSITRQDLISPHGQRQNLSPSGSGQHQPKFQPQPETTTDNTSPIKKPRLSEM